MKQYAAIDDTSGSGGDGTTPVYSPTPLDAIGDRNKGIKE